MNIFHSFGSIFLKNQLKKVRFIGGTSQPKGSIAVLFPAENLQIQQENLAFCQELEESVGLKSSPLAFIPRKLSSNVTFAFPHYCTSDLDFMGRPSNKNTDLFQQRSYHTVINLDMDNLLSLHYLCHQLKARHKVAISPSLPHLYDILLQDGEGVKKLAEFRDEILQVLTKISR